jgi:hypothetical protein
LINYRSSTEDYNEGQAKRKETQEKKTERARRYKINEKIGIKKREEERTEEEHRGVDVFRCCGSWLLQEREETKLSEQHLSLVYKYIGYRSAPCPSQDLWQLLATRHPSG